MTVFEAIEAERLYVEAGSIKDARKIRFGFRRSSPYR